MLFIAFYAPTILERGRALCVAVVHPSQNSCEHNFSYTRGHALVFSCALRLGFVFWTHFLFSLLRHISTVVEGPQLPEGYDPEAASADSETQSGEKEKTKEEWYEAMSEMGYPYYWNTVTGGEK